MHYTVGVGDSPARIAQKLTGNVARMHELVNANPHKPMLVRNGRRTFATMHVGEKLNVPASWHRFGGGASGRPRHGVHGSPSFGLGQPTTDATLMAAANALLALPNPCVLDGSGGTVCSTVSAFQQAWDSTTDPQYGPHGTVLALTLVSQYGFDGQSGPNTVNAAAAAAGIGNPPAPCAAGSYSGTCCIGTMSGGNCVSGGGGGGGGGGGYSMAVQSAAQALNTQLVQTGCTNCPTVGSAPDPSNSLSAYVSAFKQAILTNPSDWGTSTAAPTVTGSTINVSSAVCQNSFGPGTLSDLQAILGNTGVTACTDSNCICTQGATPPPAGCAGGQVKDTVTGQCVAPCAGGSAPANGVCPTTPPLQAGVASSGAGAVLAVLLLGGVAAGGITYAVSKKKHAMHRQY